MKKVTSYYCEICGTPYKSEEECMDCEGYHKHLKRVAFTGYRPVGKAKCPYAEIIIIEMEDGNSAVYSFDKIMDSNDKPVDVEEEIPEVEPTDEAGISDQP